MRSLIPAVALTVSGALIVLYSLSLGTDSNTGNYRAGGYETGLVTPGG